MSHIKELAAEFKEKLVLSYDPVGVFIEDTFPEKAIIFKENSGGGCIAPLIFKASKGSTVAFNKQHTGWACSAFYMGYEDWIFPGIEHYLSQGPLPGSDSECEKFVEKPELSKAYLETMKRVHVGDSSLVFRSLLSDYENKPETVIFYANADQISALVFLAHFKNPQSFDTVVTSFASACASVITFPLQFAADNVEKAFWGYHDISARASLPADITTFAMPLSMFEKMGSYINDSFLNTTKWEKIRKRIEK